MQIQNGGLWDNNVQANNYHRPSREQTEYSYSQWS